MKKISVFDADGMLQIKAFFDDDVENMAVVNTQAERPFVFGHLRTERVANGDDE